jgi:hypothetical protein
MGSANLFGWFILPADKLGTFKERRDIIRMTPPRPSIRELLVKVVAIAEKVLSRKYWHLRPDEREALTPALEAVITHEESFKSWLRHLDSQIGCHRTHNTALETLFAELHPEIAQRRVPGKEDSLTLPEKLATPVFIAGLSQLEDEDLTWFLLNPIAQMRFRESVFKYAGLLPDYWWERVFKPHFSDAVEDFRHERDADGSKDADA